MRDEVIQALCYRYKIRNPEDCGWDRASIVAEQIIDQGRRGTLNTTDVPPSQRLLLELEKAYYSVPGRVSMTGMNNKPFPSRVATDAARAAHLVAEQYAGAGAS